MKILFLGHGPFAAPALEALARSRHAVVGVVTKADRPQGRKMRIERGPVANVADRLGLPVAQPESVNDDAGVDLLRSFDADLTVVADFGQILSGSAIGAARLGGVNIHGSLLPKYRGAAPIPWAILNGDAESGVTIIRLAATLDGGEMLGKTAVPIEPTDTSASLEAKLADAGAKLVVEVVDRLQRGEATGELQNPNLITKARKLRKEDGTIDWKDSAVQIERRIRAMNPWPMVAVDRTTRKGDVIRMQLVDAAVESTETPSFNVPAALAKTRSAVGAEPTPGTVIFADHSGVRLLTGDGILNVVRLKPAGKKEMTVADLLRGNRVEEGERWI